MQFFWALLGELVAAALGDAVRSIRARRRREAVRRGMAVDVGCRLAVGSGRPRRGRLVLSPAQIAWHARRGRDVHELYGPRDAGAVARAGTEGHGRRVVVRLSRPAGELRLHLSPEDAATLLELLPSRTGPSTSVVPPGPPGRTGWAVACLVLATMWGTFAGTAALDTYTATARVLDNPAWATCTVAWEDASGRPHRAGSDCLGDSPGTQVVVMAWRDGSDEGVTTVAFFLVTGPAVSAALAVVGGFRLLVIRRRRRAYRAALGPTSASPGAHGAALGVEGTAAALRRGARNGWAVVALGVVCFIVFAALFTVMSRADSALRAEGGRAGGTVLDVTPDSKYSWGSARVEFPVADRLRVERVDLGGYADDYVPGDRVEVVYDPSDTRRLTIDDVPYEPPWTTWPAIAAFVGVPAAGGGGAWMLWQTRRCRRLLEAGPWQAVHVRVLPDGNRLRFVVGTHEVWRSRSAPRWPVLDREPRKLAGWGLPDEDPADVPWGQPAWWVTDGRTAVFSPDQGSPLVLASRPRR